VYVLLATSYETVVVDVTPDPHRVDVNTYDDGCTAPTRDATFAADTDTYAVVLLRRTDGEPLGGIDPMYRLYTDDRVLYTWFPYALSVKMYVLPADRFVRVYVGPFDSYTFEMFVFAIVYPAVPCATVKHISVSGT
jgi:hypothetical protein